MKEHKTHLNFKESPTLCEYLADNTSFFKSVMGPFGSGKSTANLAALMHTAETQNPYKGIRHTRHAIVRNTSPLLKSTTIKTWQQVFPEEHVGPVIFSSPITHHIKVPPRRHEPGIDCEFLFIGLDKPKDVNKLLSLDLTCAFFNEAREIPKTIIDAMTGRVGRYPPKDWDGVGATHRYILADTNAPDEDNWYFKAAEEGEIGDELGRFPWRFYRQPPAVFEVKEADKRRFHKTELMRAAGRWWRINPEAENLDNLIDGYYFQQLQNKSLDWIKRYLQADYTFVVEGRPVVPEYNDTAMCHPLEPLPGIALEAGIDLGLTPACAIGQRSPRGAWRILRELVAEDMGINRFAELLNGFIASEFPGLELDKLYMDPAGVIREEVYESTALKNLREHGFNVVAGPSNDPQIKRDTLALPMNRFIDGMPGFLIDPSCKILRKGLAGGWNYRRMQLAGIDRYADKPDKNEYSHICEAAAYLLGGGGEYRMLNRPRTGTMRSGFQRSGATMAKTHFDPRQRR